VKRKVAIIGSAYPLRGGGISTFNERLAQAFADEGDDVIIYTFSLQYPSFLFPGTTQYSLEPPPKGLNIRILINSINPFNWLRSGWIIAKRKPDLVVVRYWIPFMAPCLGTISRIVRLLTQKPVIAITDNVIPHEKRMGDRFLTSFFVNSVDRFVSLSKTVLNDLESFDKKKIKTYYPHPLYDNFGQKINKEIAKQELNLSLDDRYILFFGFIRDYKGLDLLLYALNNNKIRGLGIKLLVAGEFYSNETYYMNLIKELNLAESIVLHTQFIPNTEVYRYFCACDVVVQPYKNATQSGVTQIAYHFDKPMITTKVGGLSEMIPNEVVGYVVDPDPEKLADAIYNFFFLKKENEFSSNIVTEKQRFTWSGLLNALEKDH
jgi:glycosyltransferase involved in cell wall biosynthesis